MQPLGMLLQNGIGLWLLPMTVAPTAVVQAWIDVGSADDPADRSGLAHLAEHLVFRGEQGTGLHEQIEGLGGRAGAMTSRDATLIHAQVPSEHLPETVELLAHHLEALQVSETSLRRELDLVHEERWLSQDDLGHRLSSELFRSVFRRHPYGRDLFGDTNSLRGLRLAEIGEFRERWYRPSHTRWIVAGQFDEPSLREELVARLSSLSGPPALPRRRPSEEAQRGARIEVQRASVEHTSLALGFLTPPLWHRDGPALDLLGVVLGHGAGSLLHEELSAQPRDSSFAYLHGLRDHSLFVAGLESEGAASFEAIRGLGRALRRLCERPISPSVLDRARQFLHREAGLARLGAFESAYLSESYLALTGRENYEAAHVAAIQRLQPEDLLKVARRYLREDNANMVALVPEDAGRFAPETRLLAALRGGMQSPSRATKSIASSVRTAAAAPMASTQRAKKKPSSQAKLKRIDLEGLTLILRPDASASSVAIAVGWPGGLALEPRERGLQALLARTLVAGCANRSSVEVASVLEHHALAFSARAGHESFSVSSEWLADDVDKGLGLTIDCVTKPKFAHDKVEAAILRQWQERRRSSQRRDRLAYRALLSTLFAGQPLGRDRLGRGSALLDLHRRDLQTHFAKHYAANAPVITIAGKFDVAALKDAVSARRGDFGSSHAKLSPVSTHAASAQDVFVYRKGDLAEVVHGVLAPTCTESDVAAVSLLREVLDSPGGPLYARLRGDKVLAYQLGAEFHAGSQGGYFAVHATARPENSGEVLRLVREELAALRSTPLQTASLDAAKARVLQDRRAQMHRPLDAARLLLHRELCGAALEDAGAFEARLGALSAEDVQAAAQRLFAENRGVTATVMPPLSSPKAAARMRPVRKKIRKRSSKKRGHR